MRHHCELRVIVAVVLDGPWHSHTSVTPNTHDEVFHGTGNGTDFDATHTCDPSVVRVDGTYYMYYGGLNASAPMDGSANEQTTRVGVASSPDGFAWTRLNGGKAIVEPARNPYTNKVPSSYGTGQPSVTYVDGLYYLVRTDISGLAGNPQSCAGQYVLRSADPTFQSGVEELGASGFVPLGQAPFTGYSLAPDYWAGDWQYVDALDAFAVAESVTDPNNATVHFYDKSLHPLATVAFPAKATEELALASRPDRHAVPWGGDCGTLALDVMFSVGTGGQPGTWDLAHAGTDVKTGQSCACAPVARMLEGTLLAVPNQPLALVREGRRLQFALGPPAEQLAHTQIHPGMEVFAAIPYAASVFDGNAAYVTAGKPGAYLLDDGHLWPVSCPGELTANGSSLTTISAAAYAAYPEGAPLYCITP